MAQIAASLYVGHKVQQLNFYSPAPFAMHLSPHGCLQAATPGFVNAVTPRYKNQVSLDKENPLLCR